MSKFEELLLGNELGHLVLEEEVLILEDHHLLQVHHLQLTLHQSFLSPLRELSSRFIGRPFKLVNCSKKQHFSEEMPLQQLSLHSLRILGLGLELLYAI